MKIWKAIDHFVMILRGEIDCSLLKKIIIFGLFYLFGLGTIYMQIRMILL